MMEHSIQNGGLWCGIILGGRGRHFGTILGVWAHSGSQMPSWAVLVANMAPSWLPKRSQNREKIEAKINLDVHASWGRFFGAFLVDCGRQNGTKMVPKTHQKSISTSEGRFCKKPHKTNGNTTNCIQEASK